MSLFLYIIGGLLLSILLFGIISIIVIDFPLRKDDLGFEYVYVEEDGSVRELYNDEVEYLNTEFSPADGARPYIKTFYNDKTPDKKLWGFILRKKVPKRILIKSIDKK